MRMKSMQITLTKQELDAVLTPGLAEEENIDISAMVLQEIDFDPDEEHLILTFK